MKGLSSLKVYIGLGLNQEVPNAVRESMSSQTISGKIITVRNENVTGKNKNQLIAENRNKCRDLAMADGEPFCIISDRDLVHRYEDNLERMKGFLDGKPEFGGVAILVDRESPAYDGPEFLEYNPVCQNHVCDSFAMFRYGALKGIDYISSDPVCCCHSLCMSITESGWRYAYLDANPRLTHLG